MIGGHNSPRAFGGRDKPRRGDAVWGDWLKVGLGLGRGGSEAPATHDPKTNPRANPRPPFKPNPTPQSPPPPPQNPKGELQEPSKRAVARAIEAQDQLVEGAKDGEGLTDGEGASRV